MAKRMRAVANPIDARSEASRVLGPKSLRVEEHGYRWAFGRMSPSGLSDLRRLFGQQNVGYLRQAGLSVMPTRSKNASAEEIAAVAHRYVSAEEERLAAIRGGQRSEAKGASKRSSKALRELKAVSSSGSAVAATIGAAAGVAMGAMVGPMVAAAGGVAGAFIGSKLAVMGDDNGDGVEVKQGFERQASSHEPRYANIARRLKNP